MILLSMVSDHVVQLLYAQFVQLSHQDSGHLWLHSINERRPLTALHHISIVAGPIGERDEIVKQPTIPVHCPRPINTCGYLSRG